MKIIEKSKISHSQDLSKKGTKVQKDTNKSAASNLSLDQKDEENVIVKIENVEGFNTCRVCLKCGDIPIHGNDSFTDVSQELNAIAGINVRQDDEYPKHLCASCNSQLQGAIQLRTTAQYSEVILLEQNESRVEEAEDTSCHDNQEAGENKLNSSQNIKNIFNLKVVRQDNVTASGQKSDACFLKMEPLTVGNKSVSQQDKVSLTLRNESVSPQNTLLSECKPKSTFNLNVIKNLNIKNHAHGLKMEPLVEKGEHSYSISKPNINQCDFKEKPRVIMTIASPAIPKIIKFYSKPDKTTKHIASHDTMNVNTPKSLAVRDTSNATPDDKKNPFKAAQPCPSTTSKYNIFPLTVENPNETLIITFNGNGTHYPTTSQKQCRQCDMDFKSRQEYLKHSKTDMHKNQQRRCPICNKIVKCKSFYTHTKTHDINKISRDICDVCGKEYRKSNFAQHHRKHSSILAKKCSLCPYKCHDNNSLTKHMRTHTGEKPFQCSVCAERFAVSSNLYSHMLIKHKSKRDFVCDKCSREFHRKIDLEKHIRATHMGIREHGCPICGKTYGARKILMKHMKRNHKQEEGKYHRVPLYLRPQYQETLESDKSLESSSNKRRE